MKLYLLQIYVCIQYLFFSSCHFLHSFSPWQTISLRSLTATKAFSVSVDPLSHTGHNSAVLLETFRPVWVFSADELLQYHTRGIPAPLFTLQGTNAVLSSRQALNELILFISYPFTHTHTHHFKKIPLLMAQDPCAHTQLVFF